ncbi:hypothetical protein RQP46_002820 [Phenoliferia psychrophenolica]
MTTTSPHINNNLVNVFYTIDPTGLLSDDWYSAWVPGIVDPPPWYPFKIAGMHRLDSAPLAFLLTSLLLVRPIIDAQTVAFFPIDSDADLERARALLDHTPTSNPAVEDLSSRTRSEMKKAEDIMREKYGQLTMLARREEVVEADLLRKIFEISDGPKTSWSYLADRASKANRKLNGEEGFFALAQEFLFGVPRKPSTPPDSTLVREHPPPPPTPGPTPAEASLITIQAFQLARKYDAA